MTLVGGLGAAAGTAGLDAAVAEPAAGGGSEMAAGGLDGLVGANKVEQPASTAPNASNP